MKMTNNKTICWQSTNKQLTYTYFSRRGSLILLGQVTYPSLTWMQSWMSWSISGSHVWLLFMYTSCGHAWVSPMPSISRIHAWLSSPSVMDAGSIVLSWNGMNVGSTILSWNGVNVGSIILSTNGMNVGSIILSSNEIGVSNNTGSM